MPPMMRLPNAKPGYPRLTLNHLRRWKNSENREMNAYPSNYNSNNNDPYNVNKVFHEAAVRMAIAREVGMRRNEIIPYYRKYLELSAANNRKRGSTRAQRVNTIVRRAHRGFKNTLRTHAMMGQLRSILPRELLRGIALEMRKNALRN